MFTVQTDECMSPKMSKYSFKLSVQVSILVPEQLQMRQKHLKCVVTLQLVTEFPSDMNAAGVNMVKDEGEK